MAYNSVLILSLSSYVDTVSSTFTLYTLFNTLSLTYSYSVAHCMYVRNTLDSNCENKTHVVYISRQWRLKN